MIPGAAAPAREPGRPSCGLPSHGPGFGGIAGAAAGIAKTLFFVSLVIFVVVLAMSLTGRGGAPWGNPLGRAAVRKKAPATGPGL